MPSFQRLTIAAVTLTAVLLTNASAFAAALPPQASLGCADDLVEALFSPTVADELGLPAGAADAAAVPAVVDPRQVLADFALKLRDIRYRRGGRAPSTGFDCSGFVHYVFAHALGIDLPDDSASQFRAGTKIAREDMKTGDLVFFHTRGKYVSHVGIYLGEGRFIHSPATGERVRVNRLDEQYWSHRFVGAKRPENLSS